MATSSSGRPWPTSSALAALLALLLLQPAACSRATPPAAAPGQPGGTSSGGWASAGGRVAPQPLGVPPALNPPSSQARQLQQADEAVDRCRDGSEPAAQQEGCVACDVLQRAKTAACRVWIDRLALHFPRGSTDPPTAAQQAKALAALQGSSSPSAGCCKAMGAALEGRCGCNSLFEHVREMTAMDEPTLTVEYLKGSNALLAKACGFADAAQLACT